MPMPIRPHVRKPMRMQETPTLSTFDRLALATGGITPATKVQLHVLITYISNHLLRKTSYYCKSTDTMAYYSQYTPCGGG
jgi:hypothetical protein